MTLKPVHVIAAPRRFRSILAARPDAVAVTLHEMRPLHETAAHKTDGYAETGLL